METGTVIAILILVVVIGGGAYLATRPATPPPLLGGELGPTNDAAQIITASGGAITGLLGGIGGLYSNIGRQAGGTSAGATK